METTTLPFIPRKAAECRSTSSATTSTSTSGHAEVLRELERRHAPPWIRDGMFQAPGLPPMAVPPPTTTSTSG